MLLVLLLRIVETLGWEELLLGKSGFCGKLLRLGLRAALSSLLGVRFSKGIRGVEGLLGREARLFVFDI